MSFSDWLFSTAEHPRFPNPYVNGRWGFWHILTLIICTALIISFWLIVRNAKNKEKASKTIVWCLVGLILLFEITMKTVHFVNFSDSLTLKQVAWILLPRPWCNISCWALIISMLVKKKFFFNFASMSALLCSVIFFACPGVGYNNKIILFQNLYSIVTHALLLTTSITMIILKFTEFRYKTFWKEAICIVATFLWALFTIFVLKTERDPLYFMPDGDIQAGIFKISYGLYLVIYIVFLLIYFNLFYLIQDRKVVKQAFKRNKKAITNQ